METNSVQWIETLTNASFLWGPFFFSILFMLVITRTAHSYYSQVNERTSPPASNEERKVYRYYLIATVACGIVLVFLSVGWWMYAQLKRHTFEGIILGLGPDQSIAAEEEDDIYLRVVMRETGGGRLRRDYQFVIVRDTPFISGQAFRLAFYPNPGAIGETKPEPIGLEVRYTGGAKSVEKYRLQKNGTSFQLVKIGK